MIIETKIDRFDGGITNDPRNPSGNVARIVSNFDVLTSPKKMIALRSSESGDDAPTTSIKRNFLIALRTGTTYSLYALGVVSGTARAEILYKDLTTGAATDLDDNSWAAPANNQAPGGNTTNFNLFLFYPKTAFIYGARNGSQIWRFDPAGGAWTDSLQAITYTYIAQGLVHSKDDIMYVPYWGGTAPSGGRIAKNDNGSWTAEALTLPAHYIPTSICEYGNYLAIGCAHTDGITNSRVYLWDRNATLTTLSESIDWGTGSLVILEEIDGELVGISQKGGAATSFAFLNGTAPHRDRVMFRKLIGNRAVKFMELQADHSGGANTTQVPLYKQKIDSRLYFQMMIELNGAIRDGIWSMGRSSPESPFALIHERTSNNNTALATTDTLRGFFVVGDYIFQSYISTNHATNKTNDPNDGAPYNQNSVYESKIFDGGDPSQYKDLKEITVTTEALPASTSVALAYRTDQNTAWTTIFTNTTDNSISHTAINIESSGAALPKDYKQIQFRILATGGDSQGTGNALGAQITGLSWKEVLKGRRYNAT